MGVEHKRWKGVRSFLAWGMILLAINIILLAISEQSHASRLAVYSSVFCWVLAVTLWILAAIELKRNGGSSSMQNYMQTTCVVDRGIFRMVRHPQYLADMLFNIGIMLNIQNWMVYTAGTLSCVFLYFGIKEEEELLTKIFGNDYREYMERVPRINILKKLFK